MDCVKCMFAFVGLFVADILTSLITKYSISSFIQSKPKNQQFMKTIFQMFFRVSIGTFLLPHSSLSHGNSDLHFTSYVLKTCTRTK